MLAGPFKSRDEKRRLTFLASLLLGGCFFCHSYRIIKWLNNIVIEKAIVFP